MGSISAEYSPHMQTGAFSHQQGDLWRAQKRFKTQFEVIFGII
jgi:hypothetical protein